MPKKREKHEEIDLDKVNKILVETNIDPKKVSQWNIVAKKFYNSNRREIRNWKTFAKLFSSSINTSIIWFKKIQ